MPRQTFGWSYPPGCSGPPEPTPVPLVCLLCGERCTDEDIPLYRDMHFDLTDETEALTIARERCLDQANYAALPCPGCGDAGGLVESSTVDPLELRAVEPYDQDGEY